MVFRPPLFCFAWVMCFSFVPICKFTLRMNDWGKGRMWNNAARYNKVIEIHRKHFIAKLEINDTVQNPSSEFLYQSGSLFQFLHLSPSPHCVSIVHRENSQTAAAVCRQSRSSAAVAGVGRMIYVARYPNETVEERNSVKWIYMWGTMCNYF